MPRDVTLGMPRDVTLGLLRDVILGIRMANIPTRTTLIYNDLIWRSLLTLACSVRDATKACLRAIAEMLRPCRVSTQIT